MSSRLWRSCRFVLLCALPLVLGCGTGLGCGGERKVKLDDTVATKYELKEEDYKQLQYYIAADLVLTREVKREDRKELVKGKLVERHGQSVEEVVVKKGTPGVCVGTETKDGQHTLEVSFEADTSFKFVRGPSETAYTVTGKPEGDEIEVQFAGNSYRTAKKQVEAAYLEVGEEALNSAEKRRKTLGGRKVE